MRGTRDEGTISVMTEMAETIEGAVMTDESAMAGLSGMTALAAMAGRDERGNDDVAGRLSGTQWRINFRCRFLSM